MTDPTKQAATAKTAREVIAQAVRAADELRRSLIENAGLSENPWPGSPHALFKDALTALRTLLDAPEGGVGRLCEAAEEMVRAEEQYCIGTETTLEGAVLVHAGNAKRVYQSAIALRSALAALRASPESVGGAGGKCGWEEQGMTCPAVKARDTALDNLKSVELYRDRLIAERDAIKADLAATQRERDTLRDRCSALDVEAKRCEEREAEAKAEVKRRDAEYRANWTARERAEKELAAARGEVERLRTEIAGDSHACANGTVRPYPSVVCSLCVSRGAAPTGHVPDAGKKATPPPATEAPKFTNGGTGLRLYEAPISERARWIADASLKRLEGRNATKEDVDKMARGFAEILAAAERAAQEEGGA